VKVLQLSDCFQFDSDNIADQEVNSPRADHMSSVEDGQFLLATEADSFIRQFAFKRPLIDDLPKIFG